MTRLIEDQRQRTNSLLPLIQLCKPLPTMELVPGWVSDAGYASLSASRNDARAVSVWARQKHADDSAPSFVQTGNSHALASSYSSSQRCCSAPIPDDPHDSGQTHILPAIDMQRRQLLTYSSLFSSLLDLPRPW